MSLTHVASSTWGTGRAGWAVRLTNTSTAACLLDRRPRLAFADRNGRIPFAVRYQRSCPFTDGCSRPLTPPSAPLRVEPGQSVFFAFDSYRCDRGVKRSADVLQVLVGRTPTVRLRARTIISWCGRSDPGSTVTVSPYERTIRRALERG